MRIGVLEVLESFTRKSGFYELQHVDWVIFGVRCIVAHDQDTLP